MQLVRSRALRLDAQGQFVTGTPKSRKNFLIT
jgi:hypothetical protein